jgi:hypothetical protein
MDIIWTNVDPRSEVVNLAIRMSSQSKPLPLAVVSYHVRKTAATRGH